MPTHERHVVCCSAPYGSGGLGQHFTQLVEQARKDGTLLRYYSAGIKPSDEAVGVAISDDLPRLLCNVPPLRFSPGWRNYLMSDWFDRSVSRVFPERVEVITCFGGQALRTFRRARSCGQVHLHLQAANSHVENVRRLHEQAIRRNPIEESWLNRAQIKKTLKEYDAADVILVASEYTRQTFLAAGFAGSRLRRIQFNTNPRFQLGPRSADDGTFRVMYTGSLTVPKGIPLLIEAFSRLETTKAELTLVGGWATRGMRKYMQARMQADPRIRVAPGDPLPHLRRADVYVHPSWEDGWGYAAAEAVACGVPAIMTADTGAKELIRDGVDGRIVPTGDADAIYQCLREFLQQSK